MIEEYIVYGKSGKRIEQTAYHSSLGACGKAAYVKVCRESRKGKLQYQQRSHKVGHNTAGERYGQPEEGASEQVKGVRAYEIRTEVGNIAPAELTVSHSVVAVAVKRYLLNVEVAEKDKIPMPGYQKRYEKGCRNKKSDQKGHKPQLLFFAERVLRFLHCFAVLSPDNADIHNYCTIIPL